MRTSYIFSAALLVLASASVAGAQQKAAAPAKPAWEQTWELGFRSTTTTGDEGRYQRYEDLKSGLASKILIGKETDAVAYDFSAANVGYDDQNFSFSYNRYGKAKFTLDFNGQPLNYAFNTLTPFRDAGNNKWTLDPALRTRVQNKEVGVVGIGTTAATNVASIYRSIATEFPMSAQRNTLDMGLKYTLNKLASVDFSYKMVQKSGNQPWGAAFAFSDAQELPMTLDNGVNEITAGLELAKNEYGMVRAEYQGSFFKQNLASMEWDNPLRATDFDNGKTPPAGPWDPSGYSNGNGPAFGRMSMAPSSAMNTLKLTALYKMPNHTTLNGQIALIRMTQDDDLLPFTTNTKIAQPATYAFFPGLASLHRPTAEGQVDALN
ncbi:MAG TPA: MtrB/PioB family outer membrane beta-barrel protein, partial [Gemmatimonadaceae bacterium]